MACADGSARLAENREFYENWEIIRRIAEVAKLRQRSAQEFLRRREPENSARAHQVCLAAEIARRKNLHDLCEQADTMHTGDNTNVIGCRNISEVAAPIHQHASNEVPSAFLNGWQSTKTAQNGLDRIPPGCFQQASCAFDVSCFGNQPMNATYPQNFGPNNINFNPMESCNPSSNNWHTNQMPECVNQTVSFSQPPVAQLNQLASHQMPLVSRSEQMHIIPNGFTNFDYSGQTMPTNAYSEQPSFPVFSNFGNFSRNPEFNNYMPQHYSGMNYA